jgi:hypothetical protein
MSPSRILVTGPPGVEVIALSRENRDRLPAEISARLASGFAERR